MLPLALMEALCKLLVSRMDSATLGEAFNVYKCFTLVASLIVEWCITVDLCSNIKKDQIG